jgi:hypothetical protein
MLAVFAVGDSYHVNVNSALDTIDLHGLVPLQSSWSYLEANGNPTLLDPDFESTWFRKDMPAATYDGPTFRTGVGLFAHDVINFQNPPGTELATVLFPELQPQPHTAYFTRTFNFSGDPSQVGSLVAEILADDGAFFYLNGVNVGRVNMPPGDGVFGASALNRGNESGLVAEKLANSLITGTNYLAVSVHNQNFGDQDLGFDMRLGFRWRGESVLDNDTTDAPPPDNAVRVAEVQLQTVGASPVEVATTHGTLTMRPDGTFRYVPAADYIGNDSFVYRAGDGVSTSSLTTVTIQVQPSSGPTCDQLDLNASGVVDRGDFAAMVLQFGETPPPRTAGDYSGDGQVGVRDLVILRDGLGQRCSGAAQAVVMRAASVDRALSDTTSDVLRTSARRVASRQSTQIESTGACGSTQLEASRATKVRGDSVSARGLRARREVSV